MNISDTLAAAEVLQTAQNTARVARLRPDGTVTYGTARSVGDKTGYFGRSDQDVREMYLRVTSATGFEHFWPMRELIEEVSTGEFCRYDWDSAAIA